MYSQGISINDSAAIPDPSAMLDVSSNSKGLLIPRLTTPERDAISNPAHGLIIYNLTTDCLNYYTGALWFTMCGNCIPPPAPVAGNNGPLCEGGSLQLTASAVPGGTFSWSGPNNFTSNAQNPAIENATTAANGQYSVSVNVAGCSSSTSTTSATVDEIPSSAFIYSPDPPYTGDNVGFVCPTGGATYLWSFENGTPSSATSQNPTVTWGSGGTFNVSLTVIKNGCSSTSNASVSVSDCTGSITYNYTGSEQTFLVPSCVTSITVDAFGAEGGTGNGGGTGGKGGRVQATIPVSPGTTLYIYVGGQGGPSTDGVHGAAGFNGGAEGRSGYISNSFWVDGGGGGGASDIRQSNNDLANRILVAGGGAGGSLNSCGGSSVGGVGGGLNGGDGGGPNCGIYHMWGNGGTQSAGGEGGFNGYVNVGCNGTLGNGGGICNSYYGGGGGGGGYYGGGGGSLHGGGGGSSYVTPGANGVTHTQGVQSGNGSITITY
ncbi:MAG: PKD domain-containing protein [Crocinitomicaceae bacterium]|nr:PKD domain-containing protein [Crocinitomicaceae bacterium]